MIVRYGIVCPGCGAKIILRVGVGVDDAEPFFYVCAKCRTPTKAVQHLIYEPHPHTRLELEAGSQSDIEADGDIQVITIHPEMPAVATATEMWDTGGSPFIYQHALVEGGIVKVMERMGHFRGAVKDNWTTFKRFARFYTLQDWARFDEHGKKLLPETWPEPKTELHRHDLFHKLLYVVFAPILVPPFFHLGKAEFNLKLANAARTPILVNFCQTNIKSGLVSQLQHDVIERLDFVAANKTAMLCVLPLEFYKKGSEAAVADMRLFRDEFALLKTHYIDSYEVAHKVLTLIVGVLNCIERGDPNAFDPVILAALAQGNAKQFGKLKDLSKLEKLPNAPKRAFLGPLPALQKVWDELLDSKIRNPIGHHSARHDLATGQIMIDGEASMPYLRFAFETFRLTHLHQLLAHVLKMIQLIPLFRG